MKKVFLFVALILFFTNAAYGGIPVPPSNYTGSRTTPAGSGIEATGGYLEANGGFKIAWSISFDGSYWNYSYTLTDKNGDVVHPDVSHWIVEISPEVDFTNLSQYVFDANATVVAPPFQQAQDSYFWPEDPNSPNTTQAGGGVSGNPNLPADMIGIKFDDSSPSVGGTYTFKSIEPPVWGDFYIK